MCSFLIFALHLAKETLETANAKLKYRGPDLANINYFNAWSFLHNLLNITGTVTPQPFIQDNIVCVYNGEIYNYKDFGDYTSDGQCLISLYQLYGASFPQKLNGEFTLCLIDFTKHIILVASDTFRTKPIFVSTEPVFSCSTFSSPLLELGAINVQSFPPNTIRVYDLQTYKVLEQFQTVQFDLRQYKTNYDDWIQAFESSIRKRATLTKGYPYLCLSSGYDSGGICCALKHLDIPHRIFSIPANEHIGVLMARECFSDPIDILYETITPTESLPLRKQLQDQTEDFIYSIWESKDHWSHRSLYEDTATIGIAKICSRAKEMGLRVCLSGSGCDEILSDYALQGSAVFSHSCFNGVFPENLESIFPRSPTDTECVWKSFYKSTQEAYLMKEEYIAGSYGIETRYPYLDKQLVQEFLWLTPELKHRAYKAPLDFYMDLHKYPYEKNVKRGFSPLAY
jgi:asparagine synthetase B (glutamine-hydrolysing)